MQSFPKGHEKDLANFFKSFGEALGKQIELGQAATDSDYVTFQRSVNANVKGGAKTRHQILLRKLFTFSPELADMFDPTIIAESGVSGRIAAVSDSISNLIGQVNRKYASIHGADLFKATNKTTQAQLHIRRPITNAEEYQSLIDELYFLVRESVGTRLQDSWPASFRDVNDLRTDIRHDVDHGDQGKVRAKRRKFGRTLTQYVGSSSIETMEPSKMPLLQANLLSAIEGDLRGLLASNF